MKRRKARDIHIPRLARRPRAPSSSNTAGLYVIIKLPKSPVLKMTFFFLG